MCAGHELYTAGHMMEAAVAYYQGTGKGIEKSRRTCSALALFELRMGNITRKAAYIDTVERALYNTVLAGIALDGKSCM